MSDIDENDFDDESRHQIMKYNAESNESDPEDHENKLVSDDRSVESSSSSSDNEDLHFSQEEKKQCGRIVCSVVKEWFKNGHFFDKICNQNERREGMGGTVKTDSFSNEIRDFLEKDHEERLKLTSLAGNGKNNSFVSKLKKCIKVLCNADH